MKIQRIWTVTKDDEAPARPDGTCFWCGEPIGGIHATECVRRQRDVILDVTFRIKKSVVESWDEEQINFFYNKSSWCATNLAIDIDKLFEENECICDITIIKYIGEVEEGENS